MNCTECQSRVKVSLNGYYCVNCGESWDFIAPENRRKA